MASGEVNPTDSFGGLPMYLELIRGHIIRLVELLPGDPDDEVVIRLHIHELQHAPKYEAISYVWGSSARTVPILCNGKEFLITASLDAAFRRIRLYDRSRIVWADAICINQASKNERNHHVAFMNLVYSHAETVLVHMGSAPDGDGSNIKALIREHLARLSSFESAKQMPIIESNDPLLDDVRWRSVATLFGNQWFGRAWVLQEVGVAKNPVVLYGNVTFNYKDLMRLARWIVRCAQPLQQRAGVSLLTVHTDWVDWSENWKASVDYEYTLVDFLSAAKGLGCSDKHDHVYAFIGHHLLQHKDGSGPIIEPDYKKSVVEVYREFTSLVLPMTGSKLLSAVEHSAVTIEEDVPSWVVRWDMDVVWNSMGYYYPFYYRASGIETSNMSEATVEGRNYITNSIFVDTVEKTIAFSANGEDWPVETAFNVLTSVPSLRSTLQSILSHVNDPNLTSRYPPEHRVLALALTLGAGLRNYERAEDNTHSYEANFNAFCDILRAVNSGNSSEVQLVDEANDFSFDLNLSCKGRSFFVTRSGYFGLGPHILKPGDVCHVFEGARVPFILREAEERMYKLVGEAYLHGIMNGELFAQSVEHEWKSTVLI